MMHKSLVTLIKAEPVLAFFIDFDFDAAGAGDGEPAFVFDDFFFFFDEPFFLLDE